MSAPFTPRPWSIHVEPDYSIYRTPSVYICRGDQPWPEGQLARVNTADEFGSQVANANLIAAAPELYDALEQLSSFIAVIVGHGPNAVIPATVNSPLGIPIKVGDIMADADAALALARGENTPGSEEMK